MTNAAVLVVARAPVAGAAKTRLAASIGYRAAADLAAAALLDTLEVCRREFPTRLLAVTGDLAAAERAGELAERLAGWTVYEQRGTGLGERLAHAHADAARLTSRPVLQVGMDTPQMTAAQLLELDSMLDRYDAVLAPSEDGGWWALGVTDPAFVAGLPGVPMSSPRTGQETLGVLTAAEAEVGIGARLRDIDGLDDAVAVGRAFPGLGFSATWSGIRLEPGAAAAR